MPLSGQLNAILGGAALQWRHAVVKLYSVKDRSGDREISLVSQAILDFLDRKRGSTPRLYLGIAKAWSTFLGSDFHDTSAGSKWTAATHAEAQAFIAQCRGLPGQGGRLPSGGAVTVHPTTLRHKVMALYSLYEELRARELVGGNPWTRIRSEFGHVKANERRPHQSVDTDTVRKLLTRPNLDCLGLYPQERVVKKELLRNWVALTLLFGLALRRSEVIKIRLCDIAKTSAGTMVITLRDTKVGSDASMSLAPWIASAVDELVSQRRSEGALDIAPVLVCYYGDGIPDLNPMGDSTIYRIFKQVCKQHGLPSSITPHCSRVTAITRMLDQGLSHREVKEFSRHSSVEMVERYDRKRLSVEDSVSKKIEY